MTRGMKLFADILVVCLFAGLIVSVLGASLLNSPNTPTGGDSASHVLYAWRYSEGLFFSGDILPWMPEVFAGFPFLSYYFPLPFILIALLSKLLGLAPAFKWGSFAAAMLLPGLVHIVGRRWFKLPWAASLLGGFATLAFLLHEQNSIWGGNLLSTLSGEFAYSYGLLCAVLACFAWSRVNDVSCGWIVAAILEAATGFSHGFTLLVTGFSTIILFTESRNYKNTFITLLKGHLLAFCLLGGWLWPMLEMHSLTIPNDASFPLKSWHDLLPVSLSPVFIAGIVSLFLITFIPSLRSKITNVQAKAIRYLAAAAGISVLGFLAGDQIGLANIRFFPMAWLFSAIISGWLVGFVISALAERFQRSGLSAHEGKRRNTIILFAQSSITVAISFAMLGWLAHSVNIAPDWSSWNHSGLESKPQWNNLKTLFPYMKGSAWSPRLTFEHDPANNDLGSTRTLEAISMFIDRPVLEGLYMESALLGPAVYFLQSEISAKPSSPLVRFPSGSLDPEFAAEHLRFLHADTLLLRSSDSIKAIEATGLFHKVAEAPPFALYRLREFSSHLAEVITKPIQVKPLEKWMDDSFAWFRTRSRFLSYIPVYGANTDIAAASYAPIVKEILLDRNRMQFETAAIGKPHLIKVAWHPRWQLKSPGKLYIAGPGFMMVVPDGNEIRLEFGHTWIGYCGILATLLSLVIVLVFCFRYKCDSKADPDYKDNHPGLYFMYWAVISASSLWFSTQSPEIMYNRAFDAFNGKRYDEASPLFKRAFAGRHSPSKKEEALFWLAKTTELSGNKDEAVRLYKEVVANYHGYWVPESLYTVIQLSRGLGLDENIKQYEERLKEEYPNSKWVVKTR